MNNTIVYKKYSNCIITKGYLRSLVSDLQKMKYGFIPNEICQTLNGIFFDYQDISKIFGDEFMDYLLDSELVFCCNMADVELFPDLNLTYQTPNYVENAIIDIWNKVVLDSVNSLLEQLDCLNCNALQFRYYYSPKKCDIHRLLDLINNYSFESVELLLSHSEWVSIPEIEALARNYRKLTSVIIYGAKTTNLDHIDQLTLSFITDVVIPNADCGKVHKELFIVTTKFAPLAYCYNTCHYKKISIDKEGNIKNCPSCSQSFGNIKDTTLAQALSHPDFKKYWNITKDQIDVCKDCEFRHMCTDCRVFIKDTENIYSQPAKCTYNPYIAKWQGEDGYVPVEECGTYSRETGFVVNHKRVAELNELLWD
jgi:SPASM domain peptide maturase of grasp-with-spasm system